MLTQAVGGGGSSAGSGLIVTEIERRRRKAAMGDKVISMSLNKIFPSTVASSEPSVGGCLTQWVLWGLFVCGSLFQGKGCRSDERKEPAAA